MCSAILPTPRFPGTEAEGNAATTLCHAAQRRLSQPEQVLAIGC